MRSRDMRLFLALDKTGINWEWVVSFARYAELGVVQARRHPSALRLVAPVRLVAKGDTFFPNCRLLRTSSDDCTTIQGSKSNTSAK